MVLSVGLGTFTEGSHRLCLPLDEARELFDTEREVFGWMRGHGKYGGILI